MPRAIDAERDSRTAFRGFAAHVRRLIEENGYRRVCEIGGGRSPMLDAAGIDELGLDYTLLDVSADELALAPPALNKVVGDISSIDTGDLAGRFDFMFSRMVAEHVPDGRAMHRNVFEMLAPGGRAFHFFPTLWTPVFVVNRLLPEPAARRVLDAVLARKTHEKFPARYSMCFGPTQRNRSILAGIGYRIDEYRPFYGHAYFDRLPGLRSADRALSAWAARRRNPFLTSYAYLVVRKPG